MKKGFYPKLAWNGIKKNSRMYTPYILTCVGMIMMYYIISALSLSDTIKSMRGGTQIATLLGFGKFVMTIFSLIFLFYTNSFLSRRRKKEFGLYNILGMGKFNIARILFCETLITSAFSIVGGVAAGIVFSKLAELVLTGILGGEVSYAFTVSWMSVFYSAVYFLIIFALIFLNTLRYIHLAKPVELLHSENSGEKPPKANWVIGILGLVLLVGAYYISLTIESPIAALALFFVAVVMVIIGTYMLFIAGSVLFCRILQKRKNYYYKSNHFVSVSSMVYRMKRNGAGLASICILATMVLVIISSTTSLYFGSEDAIHARYPYSINVTVQMNGSADATDENAAALRAAIDEEAQRFNANSYENTEYRSASVTGLLDGAELETDVRKVEVLSKNTMDNVLGICMVPLADYNKMTGSNEKLEPDEILIYTVRTKYQEDTFAIKGGKTFRVKKQLTDFVGSADAAMNVTPTMFIVVPNFETAFSGIENLCDYNRDNVMILRWNYGYNTDIDKDEQIKLNDETAQLLRQFSMENKNGVYACFSESMAEESDDFYGTYGGMLFLGVLLSLVFGCAAVLIIYYKQISEGYEDQSRFDIMQKVGMTKRDIRKSINSQLLTVFFMPLVVAGIHLAFAFPIISKLLALMNLQNITLFAITTVVSFILFALIYTIVYRITSNAYYSIVSDAKDK